MLEKAFEFTLINSRYVLSALLLLILGSCVFSLLGRHFGKRVGAYLTESGGKNKRPLSRWENSIGRSNACDVILSAGTVSRFHAVITKRSNGWFVTDTNSKTGVFVNGKQITGRTPLKNGDSIAFGTAAYKFVDTNVAEAEPEAEAAPSPKKQAATAKFIPAMIDEAADRAYCLSGDSFVIGRDTGCDIRLNYAAVSREHAKIYRLNEAWFIEDLGSSLGTKVNARAISGRRRLRDGDVIGLGGIIFIFNEQYKQVKSR